MDTLQIQSNMLWLHAFLGKMFGDVLRLRHMSKVGIPTDIVQNRFQLFSNCKLRLSDRSVSGKFHNNSRIKKRFERSYFKRGSPSV